MKTTTILTLLALSAASFTASAQIQQGNVMVGGNLANVRLGLDDSKIVSIDLSPKAAWFVRNNLALGAYTNLGIASAKESSTVTTYGVGALSRYYAGADVDVLRHGRIFGELTLGLGGKNVGDGGDKTNGLEFGIGPGFAYFITPNIGLETLLKYNKVAGFGNATSQSDIGLSFGFQIYLPGRSTANKVKNDTQ